VTTSDQPSPLSVVGQAAETALHARSRTRAVPATRGYRRTAVVLAALTAVLGISVIAGWAVDQPLLTSWLPGLVRTRTIAAVCLVLVGLAVVVRMGPDHRRYRLVAAVLAGIAVAIAGATFLEQVTGIDLGIDQVLAVDTSTGLLHPGRLAGQTAVAFMMAGLAVLLLGRRVRGGAPAEVLGLAAGAIGFVAVLGYLYSASQLVSLGSSSGQSLPCAVGLMLLGGAILDRKSVV
jgi:hypothetical protein